MWHQNFADRLAAWHQLRADAADLDLPSALVKINSWWLTTPWHPYYLHWDDRNEWPDPWQLLDDNIYCGLARGLGIMYTIAMLDREDMKDASLFEAGSDNLVQVSQEKYILNWDSETIVNISPGAKNSKRQIALREVEQIIK
jgi:hypothetical protein